MRDFYDALTHPEVGLFLSISFMMMLAFSLMQGTFALFSEHTLHLTAKDNGFLFAYLGLTGVVMQMFLLRPILKKISERKATLISIFLMALSMVLIALSTNLFLLIIAMTLLGIGNSLSGPVLAGLISKKTPENEQGNIMGVSQSVGSVGRLIGPVVGTFVFSQFGVVSPYYLAAAVLGLTLIISFRSLTAENVSK